MENPLSAEMRNRRTRIFPELRELALNWAGRSEAISYEMTLRDGVQARMAIRKVRGKSCDTVYVLVHGLFGESENWKYVVGALGDAQEIWAVDLVGGTG